MENRVQVDALTVRESCYFPNDGVKIVKKEDIFCPCTVLLIGASINEIKRRGEHKRDNGSHLKPRPQRATTIGRVRGVTRQKLEIRIRYRKLLYALNKQWSSYLSDSYAYVRRRCIHERWRTWTHGALALFEERWSTRALNETPVEVKVLDSGTETTRTKHTRDVRTSPLDQSRLDDVILNLAGSWTVLTFFRANVLSRSSIEYAM